MKIVATSDEHADGQGSPPEATLLVDTATVMHMLCINKDEFEQLKAVAPMLRSKFLHEKLKPAALDGNTRDLREIKATTMIGHEQKKWERTFINCGEKYSRPVSVTKVIMQGPKTGDETVFNTQERLEDS